MRWLGRLLLILPLVIWLGGIIFFSFVVAPSLFSLLPSSSLAGNVVNRSLGALHYIGLACGIIFLAATFLTELRSLRTLRSLVGVMLLCTVLSQFGVIPQMRRIREAVGGAVELLPPTDAGRAAFEHLHQLSVVLEAITLLAGLGIIALISRENQQQ
ncbi:MAG TPA: DUF4149 domain-containing protein [Terriglobales bacterium]|nr:DUF4149 domain-containing protein [Terriglobales bacterium]